MINQSHLTAIGRSNKLPTPTRFLYEKGLLIPSVLDYGCGRCHNINNKFFNTEGFDPFYRPFFGEKKLYKTIICNYVLCVLPKKKEHLEVLKTIQSLLKEEDGIAYVSVRNEKPPQGYGWTPRKTYQAKVRLDLPVMKTTREFIMYELRKNIPLAFASPRKNQLELVQ